MKQLILFILLALGPTLFAKSTLRLIEPEYHVIQKTNPPSLDVAYIRECSEVFNKLIYEVTETELGYVLNLSVLVQETDLMCEGIEMETTTLDFLPSPLVGVEYISNRKKNTDILYLLDQIVDFVMGMKGVNSIGTQFCDSSTGKPIVGPDTVIMEECLVLGAETKRSVKALRVLFPVGSRIKGYYIYTKFNGPTVPHDKN